MANRWSFADTQKPTISHSKAHFTLGVKGEIEKIFSICPKLLINAELYGLLLALGVTKKKGYHRIWEANLQLLGPMFQYLLIS
jgi:hypothetical protein